MGCRRLEDLDQLGARPRVGASSATNATKLIAQLLPPEARTLYEQLKRNPRTSELGELGEVDIGAVTGDNKFFLVSDEHRRVLPDRLMRTCISKAVHVPGARLTRGDVSRLERAGAHVRLFVATKRTSKEMLAEAEAFLAAGIESGVDERFKCRTRNPWWAVPLPKRGVADLFLTYCAHRHPRLVVNQARALNTNTVHGVTLHDPAAARALTAGFYNSLTLLSAELVGRSYGGGVLKLEPTEAEALLIPPRRGELAERLPEIDTSLRAGDLQAVLSITDPVVLGDGLGLGADEIRALRLAGSQLRERRHARRKPARVS